MTDGTGRLTVTIILANNKLAVFQALLESRLVGVIRKKAKRILARLTWHKPSGLPHARTTVPENIDVPKILTIQDNHLLTHRSASLIIPPKKQES